MKKILIVLRVAVLVAPFAFVFIGVSMIESLGLGLTVLGCMIYLDNLLPMRGGSGPADGPKQERR